jgi:uncharacterized protein DUF3658
MDREQAVDIHRNLQRAVNAMRRAERLILDLDQEDRAALAKPFGNTTFALHFELLREIYRRFPDLQPPSKGARFVDSMLTWKQVQLPPSVTEGDIDVIIFSVMKPRFQKVAMVIIQSLKRCEELGLPVDDQVIAARLRLLADAGRIEGAGDLRKWRFSEVRLKG